MQTYLWFFMHFKSTIICVILYFQRIPKLQQQDQGIWWDTLAKMQKLFRKSSISLFNSGKIDKDTMHNYYMSGNYKK